MSEHARIITVIPVYNGERYIRATLDSLAHIKRAKEEAARGEGEKRRRGEERRGAVRTPPQHAKGLRVS